MPSQPNTAKVPMIKEKTYILKLRWARVIMSNEIIAIIHIDTVCKIELLAKLSTEDEIKQLIEDHSVDIKL